MEKESERRGETRLETVVEVAGKTEGMEWRSRSQETMPRNPGGGSRLGGQLARSPEYGAGLIEQDHRNNCVLECWGIAPLLQWERHSAQPQAGCWP